MASAPGASAPTSAPVADAVLARTEALAPGAVPASSVGPIPDCAKVPGQEGVEVVMPPLDGMMLSNATPDASVDRSYPELGPAVQRRLGGLRCCYAAARQRQPGLAGRVVLALDLDGDGRVKSVSQLREKSDINEETMTACVVATGRELAFSASRRGGPTRVTLPLLFRPREAR